MKRLYITLAMILTVFISTNAQITDDFNYIRNIQPLVDKYYPAYSGYFKEVIKKFDSYDHRDKYLVNSWNNKIYGSVFIFKDLIKTDKDKVTTALIVFDYLEGSSKFIKDTQIIHRNADGSEDNRIRAANAILKKIKEDYDKTKYFDYVRNTQPLIEKYFPQYSTYFKNVLAKFKEYGPAEKFLINKHINKTLKNYNEYDDLTSEKDKIATALIVLDYLEGESRFIKDKNIIKNGANDSEDIKVGAANEMLKWIKLEYDGILKDWDKFKNEISNIGKRLQKETMIKENALEIISQNEQIMERYKEYFIVGRAIRDSRDSQEWVLSYIQLLDILHRQPSLIGELYIEEYNSIKNKK